MAGFPIGINMLSVSHLRPAPTPSEWRLGYGQPDVGLQLIDLARGDRQDTRSPAVDAVP